MGHTDELIATDIEQYLQRHETKSSLRFITCGSVDDGKSTLIGRLLYESAGLFDDQISVLKADSKNVGTRGAAMDYALLLDGLAAEREQGITIDVAYRYFSTDRRKFIVADTPGHEQYTRNMVTGASTAGLAIVLVDARKGILVQTRRHSFIVSLLGIRHIVLAINKMDLVGYSRQVFDQIEAVYREFAEAIGLTSITAIPLCATDGDNVVHSSKNTAWYSGPTLIHHLESVEIDGECLLSQPFRLPVQWVSRPNQEFRGFAGTIASGVIRPGQRIRVVPSGRESIVSRIVTFDGDLPSAVANQSIMVTLGDEVDISRGDVISGCDTPAQISDQFEVTLAWLNQQPLLRGRSYLLKIGPKTATATVTPLKYKVDISTLEHIAAEKLELNEIGVAEIELDRPIAFDSYESNRDTGGFILIDRLTNNTVGAGMIRFALRRAENIHWQAVSVDKAARRTLNAHSSCVIWLTGLSGSGKSTIADLLEKRLHAQGKRTYLLDGDNVRHGLNKDLGFDAADRVENIRRVAEVAKLMADAGIIVLAAFISPFRAERQMVRNLMEPGEFIEVYVNATIEVAEQRDPKGLYRKARSGELRNFTGIDLPYEAPEAPEIEVDTTKTSAVEGALQIYERLLTLGSLELPVDVAPRCDLDQLCSAGLSVQFC